MNTCKKCNCEFQSNFCPDCGHPQKLERINGRYIVSEIASVLNFQKGFFYSIKELLIRPGQNIKVFISEDRNHLVNPITFILITSLIYAIIIKIFHFEDGIIDGAKDALDNSIFNWVQENYGYANIIMSFFIGLWVKIFFRKYSFNFFEILVLLCFVMGIGMLIYSAFDIVRGLTHTNLVPAEILVGFIYTTWAVGQFFEKRKISVYIKSLISYLLGVLTFTIVLLAIMILFNLIK